MSFFLSMERRWEPKGLKVMGIRAHDGASCQKWNSHPPTAFFYSCNAFQIHIDTIHPLWPLEIVGEGKFPSALLVIPACVIKVTWDRLTGENNQILLCMYIQGSIRAWDPRTNLGRGLFELKGIKGHSGLDLLREAGQFTGRPEETDMW